MTKNLNLIIFFFFWGGGGTGDALIPTQYARLSTEVKYKNATNNYLHNVEHVVLSTFRNMLITFEHKPCDSNFELYIKRILTKNPNLKKKILGGRGGGRGGLLG